METLKPAGAAYLTMLADMLTAHWYDTIPRSIPVSDNREAKYLSSATLSVNAVSANNYNNIIQSIVEVYQKTAAFKTNAKLTSDVETNLCIECCRTFFPDYIFEMMANNATGMRSFFNNVLAGTFAKSLVLIKEYTKSDLALVLKNDPKFRKFTHENIMTTIVAFRNSIHSKAIQTDISRAETPAMLKDEIVRLKKNLHRADTALKNKTVAYDAVSAQLARTSADLAHITHDVDVHNTLSIVLDRLGALEHKIAEQSGAITSIVDTPSRPVETVSVESAGHSEALVERITEHFDSRIAEMSAKVDAVVERCAKLAAPESPLCENITAAIDVSSRDRFDTLATAMSDLAAMFAVSARDTHRDSGDVQLASAGMQDTLAEMMRDVRALAARRDKQEADTLAQLNTHCRTVAQLCDASAHAGSAAVLAKLDALQAAVSASAAHDNAKSKVKCGSGDPGRRAHDATHASGADQSTSATATADEVLLRTTDGAGVPKQPAADDASPPPKIDLAGIPEDDTATAAPAQSGSGEHSGDTGGSGNIGSGSNTDDMPDASQKRRGGRKPKAKA